jgi:hypothetical protein
MPTPTRIPLVRIASSLTLLAALAIGPRPACAQTWNETGDAGSLIGTAQHTTGTGPLTAITGTLSDSSDVDLYCIHVTSPSTFFAGLLCVAISDPNIWLFDASGIGVSAQDNCMGNYTLITNLHVSTPGTYYLAVAAEGRQAVGPGGPIWLTSVFSPVERAPDGIGAPGPLVGWTGAGHLYTSPFAYQINLGGAEFCDAPTPVSHRTWGELKSIYR